MTRLHQIHCEVRQRSEEILSGHEHWPCRKGCDECCRHLASEPTVTEEEWRLIVAAIGALPADTAESVRQRIRGSALLSRPVVCPLLDSNSGTCLVYEARPIACRAYGFYAERREVLGCSRIESIAEQTPDVVWGNHAALEERVRRLGSAAELSVWLDSTDIV
jgi:uncharacterized protein